MTANDPWSWTVDELVVEICHSDVLFKAAGCSATSIPDLEALENQVRTRQVSGKTFLTALDNRALVLRNELSIPHLNQRMAVTSVVGLLQHRSYLYKQHATTVSIGSLDINNANHLPSVPLNSSLDDNTLADEAGRKRRKVTHLSSIPVTNVLRTNAGRPLSPAGTSKQSPPNRDEWDHLLRWQHLDDDGDVLDLAESDDDEEEEEYFLEYAAEEDPQDMFYDDKEGVEETQGRNKLGPDQVTEIINERIEFFANSWKPNKGVIRGEEIRYDPESMWLEAEEAGQRYILVEKYETDHAYYTQRLDRLCDEILKFPGSNPDKVRRQCANLEVTVDSMELADWMLSIYRLEPVENSDEEQEDVGQDNSMPHCGPDPQAGALGDRPKPTVEIIDLGSPSESSGFEERDGLPFDNLMGTASDRNVEQIDAPRRVSTPDSVIADTVEPPTDAPPMPLTFDGISPVHTPVNHGDQPEHASITTVRRWRWPDLVEHQDRKRVVSKAIYEMKIEDRELIRSRIKYVGKPSLIKEISACVHMLCKGESKLQGILPRDMPKIIAFTDLFLSWWFCDDYFTRPRALKRDITELKQHIDDGTAETGTFYNYVATIMTTTFSESALQHPERPSQVEIIEISDDE